ncbi:MAG: prephenate dehydrogenase [Candidatus Omnitrophica bacterium]|nr:prephenate dehydrogenase [Candidatus Omnitrophota bacterium]
MAEKFRKVVIVGTGFMGGCLAKAIKKKKIAHLVWGVVRNKRQEKELKKLNIFDEVTTNYCQAFKSSDFIILATPVFSILQYIKILPLYISKDCVVTDVGSTKEFILKSARKYIKENFVGSHPLCGSEKKGAINSVDFLFENSLCIITPIEKNKPFKIVRKFWRDLGCKTVILKEGIHDKILAYTSGLPHLLSFSLSASLPPSFSKFIPASFKELTRISGSPPQVWVDIFLTNRFLIKMLDNFLKNLTKLSELIEKRDRRKLNLALSKISKKHRELVSTSPSNLK